MLHAVQNLAPNYVNGSGRNSDVLALFLYNGNNWEHVVHTVFYMVYEFKSVFSSQQITPIM